MSGAPMGTLVQDLDMLTRVRRVAAVSLALLAAASVLVTGETAPALAAPGLALIGSSPNGVLQSADRCARSGCAAIVPVKTLDPQPPPPDVVPPWSGGRVYAPVVSPGVGTEVSGFVAIELQPTGPVEGVKWFVDGVEIGYDGNGGPWVKGWDSTTVANGAHELYSLARQPAVSPDAGRWFSSERVVIVVNNSSNNLDGTEPAPTGDLPGWSQIFVDDFTTDVALGDFPQKVSARWSAYPSPWRDTSGKGLYAPQRVVSVNDGVLNKFVHSENGQALVSALQPKINDAPQSGSLYGRYSVRFRTDRIEGYKVAWMLWPDTGTNVTGSASGIGGNGEIDFPELDLDSEHVMGFVHHQDATRSSDQYWSKTAADVTQWHIYTIEWSPGLVVLLLDGIEVGRTTERVPDTSMHWVLQTETSLTGTTSPSEQGNVEIDWVAMWEYTGQT